MDKLIKFFNNFNIDYLNKKFILAVSTGIDSMVMLDKFLELKKHYNIEIVVAHVNHQIREQSMIEEKYIMDFCKDNCIDCYVKKLEFLDNQTNFEAVAREQRYAFMFKLYDELKADYLVLAHHANDNIETIIMRLLRGSSLAGYGGMQELNIVNERKVIRPFLNLPKEDIIKYQQDNNVQYFNDDTNNSYEYTRNRIRMEIVPKLFIECNDLINKFNDFRKTIYEASKIVNSERKGFIEKNVQSNYESIVVNRNEFLKLTDYMQQEVLFEILKEYKLSKVNINQFIKIIKSDKKNYYNWFKEKVMFKLEYDKIIISSKQDEIACNEIIIKDLGKYYFADNKSISVEQNLIKNDYNLNELWYNSMKLPLTIRSRKNGDKIIVNGCTKKLKDLFIDMKIPVSKRDSLLIVEKDDQILCVLGVIKSDLVKDIKDTDILIKIVEESNG